MPAAATRTFFCSAVDGYVSWKPLFKKYREMPFFSHPIAQIPVYFSCKIWPHPIFWISPDLHLTD
jgi:hypothetical protein